MMLGALSLIVNSGADSHKASMALNMDGTCMQGLYLSSYQGSTLRHAVALLQLPIQCSVDACFHKRKTMKEDARFECNNTSTSSIMMFSKFYDAHTQALSITLVVSVADHNGLRDHFLYFFQVVTYSIGDGDSNIYVWCHICCATDNRFAAIQFCIMQQSFDENAFS